MGRTTTWRRWISPLTALALMAAVLFVIYRELPHFHLRSGGVPVAFANLWTTQNREELSIDLMRFGPDAPRRRLGARHRHDDQ